MGELHGKGKIKKASGEEYEGDWVLNIREGEGVKMQLRYK